MTSFMNAKPTRTMSNEIKVGDKVRVREDAPSMFRSGFNHVYTAYISKVLDVDDGNAIIEMTMANMQCQERIIIPTKYLVKVEDEAKEAKFKVGDKVVRKNVSTVRTIISIDYEDDDKDPSYYYNTVDSQGNNPMDFVESELILYTESTPKYKKGDRVKICSKDAARFGCVGTILEVHENGTVDVDFNDYYVGGHLYSIDFIEPYTEPTEQTEVEKNDADNLKKEAEEWANTVCKAIKEYGDARCKIYVEAHNEAYWDIYTADLAKEVALKVANKFNAPHEAAEYAVSVAKSVAEGLKRK